MKSTDSEQEGVGMELEQYRNRLEQMVEEKSKDLIAIQENLEATNRRQALFIKVLQILQLEPDIPTAMNMALAEIGRYTGVDRLATWENHLDGITYGCTNEWCNDGIEPAIDYLRSMTIEAGKPWFDMLEENHIICTSDIYSLDPFITQMLEIQGVKINIYVFQSLMPKIRHEQHLLLQHLYQTVQVLIEMAIRIMNVVMAGDTMT